MWGYRTSFKKRGAYAPFFHIFSTHCVEQLGPVLHLETVIEQAQLFFYGEFCHIQLLGDFLVGPAFFHPLDHQFFPGTEDFFLQRTAFCRGEE